MSAITLFSSAYSGADQIAEKVAALTGYRVIADRELIEAAVQQYDIDGRELERAIYTPSRFFNMSSRKKALAIAGLKLVLAEFLEKEPCIYLGYAGHLIPRRLSFRALIAAGTAFRVQQVFRDTGKAGKTALQHLRREDRHLFSWTRYMKEKENRSMAAYDWVIPSDKLDPDASAAEIIRHLAEKSELSFSKDELQPALNDFVKAARVAFVLARKGYDVPVRAKQGRVTLTVNKHVILLSSLKQKLKKIALDVNGVDDVKVEVGRRYYRANICHGYHYRISSADIRANYAQKYAELYQSAELRCGRQIQLTSGR